MKVDYFDSQSETIEELIQKLRNKNPDDLQNEIITLSMKMAELRQMEMK